MPDLKISALSDGGAAQSSDEIPAARAGTNVSLTPPAIAASHRGVLKADAYTAVSGDDILAGVGVLVTGSVVTAGEARTLLGAR